jgi:CRP/FNR family transcriptional regulator, cyclic AMP receptor protein
VDWPLLAPLDDAQRSAVLAATRRRTFRRNEAIFHEGDPGDTLHLLESGHVAVRVATQLGEAATIRVLAPGQWFGEMALLSEEPRMASVVALEPVVTRSLHRDDMRALQSQYPVMDQVLLAAMTAEVKRLSMALADAMFMPVPKRVARTLLDMRAKYSSDTIPLTQDDLAGLCGTTRQTVNAVLAELEQAGAVEVRRGRVVVVDVPRVERAGR